jgi:hypothetical protein
VALEDDEWALRHLRDSDDRDSSFGVGTYRWRDAHNVVHRVVWTHETRGWASLCGVRVPRESDASVADPGGVTCIMCMAGES